MQLLVIRHAIAEDRETWAPRDDKLRPLTDDGKKKMKEAAKALRSLVPKLDVLATSPLTRAAQTAEILAKVYDGPAPAPVDALAPGQRPAALASWLRTQALEKTVAIVGHEPGLGAAASWLATGTERSFLDLGKGGACFLDLGERVEAGEGMVLWVMRPSQLRGLR